jgi:hypothetical protein
MRKLQAQAKLKHISQLPASESRDNSHLYAENKFKKLLLWPVGRSRKPLTFCQFDWHWIK